MAREAYVRQLFGEDDPILRKVRKRIKDAGMPDISVAPEWGRWLTMLARMTKASRILEIGALGGYSGICLARGLGRGGKLISLEVKPSFAQFAKDSLAMAKLDHLVDYRVGEAMHILPKLAEEGEVFDLVFIDADKKNYPHYLEWALELSRPGGVIVGDNALLHDRVLDESDGREATVAMRTFNEMVMRDERLEGLILPFHDGLAVAVVRSSNEEDV